MSVGSPPRTRNVSRQHESADGPPRGYRVGELASALHLPRSSAYALVRRGELPAIRFGARLIVLEADLKGYLAANRTSEKEHAKTVK